MNAMVKMIRHNVIPGSDDWLELRGKYNTASEAPVIMGCHPNMKRDELLEAKATMNPKEFSRFVEEVVFAKGHETEAMARPILEARLDEDLYPIVTSVGDMLASHDGVNDMDAGDTGFEHKQRNAALAALVEAGNPPPYIYWQLEHQLIANPDLKQIILVVSDGTEENWAEHVYTPAPGRREQLLAGWDQFNKDRAEFKPAHKTVEATGVRPDSLPALFVDVAGALTTTSNLVAFRAGAEQLIGSIKTDLVTDQDFADAEAAVKWLDDTEKNIDMVIQQALSKTGPLDELIRTLKDVQQNLARQTRLKLSKQVEAQKLNRRNQIVQDASGVLNKYLSEAGEEFAPAGVKITGIQADFYTAIKGKRSFDMMASSCNDMLAQTKIATTELCGKLRKNLALLAEHKDHDFLFPNKQQLAYMEHDHLALTVKTKISDYKAEQEATETARVQRHRNVIAGIEAAGDFDDMLPLAALLSTRDRIAKQDISGLQEFVTKADQIKVATLAKLDARIQELRDAETARLDQIAAEAAKEKLAPVVAAALTKSSPILSPAVSESLPKNGDLPPLDEPSARDERCPPSSTRRPTDNELVAVIAQHYNVTAMQVITWLEGMNLSDLVDELSERNAA